MGFKVWGRGVEDLIPHGGAGLALVVEGIGAEVHVTFGA
jgi:hypothetical protein